MLFIYTIFHPDVALRYGVEAGYYGQFEGQTPKEALTNAILDTGREFDPVRRARDDDDDDEIFFVFNGEIEKAGFEACAKHERMPYNDYVKLTAGIAC